jgi:hypothetical protein
MTSLTSGTQAAGAVVPVGSVAYFPSSLWKGAKRLPFHQLRQVPQRYPILCDRCHGTETCERCPGTRQLGLKGLPRSALGRWRAPVLFS